MPACRQPPRQGQDHGFRPSSVFRMGLDDKDLEYFGTMRWSRRGRWVRTARHSGPCAIQKHADRAA